MVVQAKAANKKYILFIMALSVSVLAVGCQRREEPPQQDVSALDQDILDGVRVETQDLGQAGTQAANQTQFPMTIKHQLGETVITKMPHQVAALSMNEADFLNQLDVPIAGMVKDFVPHFLDKYKDDDQVVDLGSIVQPNMEKVYALHPDLILITPLQAQSYNELTQIAPTLHFDIDYDNSEEGHIAKVRAHLLTLGAVFNKKSLAEQKVAMLDTKLAEVKKITINRPETALVVLHNNGAFSNFGVQSRYGFVFSDLGVKPASTVRETSLHGEPISSEFIQNANPDILYIVDRTAVMEHRDTITPERVNNPLLEQTNAWKNGHVVFVDADAWYTTSASPSSLMLIMDDVIKGYQSP